MAAEIVHHDDIARGELRYENLLDISEEGSGIDRAIEDIGCYEAQRSEPGDEGLGQPVAVRNARDASFAHRAPAIKRRHVGLGPRLIDKDEARDVNARLHPEPCGAPSCHVRALLFGGAKGFF